MVDTEGEAALLAGRDGCHVVPGPLYHNAPFTSSMTGLIHGNHVVVLPKFDAEATLRAIHDHRATFILMVPTMMLRISRLPDDVKARYDLSSLQVVWHMAAPCPMWLKEAWIEWLGGERIYELYAGTEAQAVTIIRGDEWMEHKGSVGRVAVGEMKVVDADGEDLPAGEVGEILMRTSAEGSPTYRYVGAEARTRRRRLGEPRRHRLHRRRRLRLPDRPPGRHDPHGRGQHVPRRGGAALDGAPVVQTGARHRPARRGPRQPGARRGADRRRLTDDELRAFLGERLVRYKVPRTFELVDGWCATTPARSAARPSDERRDGTVHGCSCACHGATAPSA